MDLQNQQAVIRHYDALIDEGNDPVQDPAPLRRYMDGWDGAPFLGALALSGEETVLEIGVGRPAIRAIHRKKTDRRFVP